MPIRKLSIAAAAILLGMVAPASAVIRIAYTDALSGPSAIDGANGADTADMEVERLNAAGGILGEKIELKRFDNKNTPQEALVQLQSIIAEGYRIVFANSSSGAGIALETAITRYNERNPDKSILFLNGSAVAPEMTNEKCSFWQFRFDINSDQKLLGLVDAIAADKTIKKVYLFGGDYVLGQQVSKGARTLLAQKRPDIQIVGDELHPFQKVTDFSPYIAKIKASGADAVITANFTNDLALPIKAAKDAGLNVQWFTFYANLFGVPTALAGSGVDRVHVLVDWHVNLSPNPLEETAKEFKKRYGVDFIFMRVMTGFEMLKKAMEKANTTTDSDKIAAALEDMRYDGPTGQAWMRKSDHQLMTPQYLITYAKVNGSDVKYGSENTEYGFRTSETLGIKDIETPTTCKMKRPAGM